MDNTQLVLADANQQWPTLMVIDIESWRISGHSTVTFGTAFFLHCADSAHQIRPALTLISHS